MSKFSIWIVGYPDSTVTVDGQTSQRDAIIKACSGQIAKAL